MEGQINLKDAVRRNISYRDPKSGKTYQLKPQVHPPPLNGVDCVPQAHVVLREGFAPAPICIADRGLRQRVFAFLGRRLLRVGCDASATRAPTKRGRCTCGKGGTGTQHLPDGARDDALFLPSLPAACVCAQTAVLFVRPRGWHLLEKHMHVDRQPVPAAIFDFALFFFHNAKELLARGSGPYFYLPKMQVPGP